MRVEIVDERNGDEELVADGVVEFDDLPAYVAMMQGLKIYDEEGVTRHHSTQLVLLDDGHGIHLETTIY